MRYTVSYQKDFKILKQDIYLQNDETVKEIFEKYPNVISLKNRSLKKKGVFFQRVSKDEVYLLFGQLSMMVDSGLTFVEAIDIIKKKNSNKIVDEILQRLKEAIVKSLPIDTLLVAYEKYLGKTPIVFLKLGFENGNINDALKALVEVLKEDIAVKNQLMQSLRYPVLLLISLVIAVGMVFLYVLPNFEFIFKAQKTIPFATKLLLELQYIVSNYYLFIISGCIFFGLLGVYLSQRYQLQRDIFLIKHIPLFSRVLQYYYFYKLFLAMSIIVDSKLQFQVAILNSKKIIANLYIQKIIEQILQEIKNGNSIAQSFAKYSLFDEVIIKLLVSAENSSHYSQVLSHIGSYYKKKFQNSIQNFQAVLEPLIILVIAIIVLWLILAIMVPIWDMANLGL